MVAGTFSGWRYRKMIPLHVFNAERDKEYETPYLQVVYSGLVRRRDPTKDVFDESVAAELGERELAHI